LVLQHLEILVYVQTSEPSDFSEQNLTFLEPSFIVDQNSFENISPNSLVILDDYHFDKRKQTKSDFLKILNYNLRHHNICLFLVLHNLLHNNLYSDILYAPHIFISYSNMGYSIMRYKLTFHIHIKNNVKFNLKTHSSLRKSLHYIHTVSENYMHN
jgi:hypothetical protein